MYNNCVQFIVMFYLLSIPSAVYVIFSCQQLEANMSISNIIDGGTCTFVAYKTFRQFTSHR